MVVRPWWTCICMASPPADDVCAVALVVGDDISVTHLTIGKSLAKILQKYAKILAKYRWHTWQWGNLGKNIALWWPGWSHLVLYSYLRWFGGWRGISSSLIHWTHASLSEERKHVLSSGHGHKCTILMIRLSKSHVKQCSHARQLRPIGHGLRQKGLIPPPPPQTSTFTTASTLSISTCTVVYLPPADF